MDQNVAEYFIYLCVAVIGTAGTVLALKLLIPRLRELKIGQMILSDGPKWHLRKQGTPTMGGLGFIAVITAAIEAERKRAGVVGGFRVVSFRRK